MRQYSVNSVSRSKRKALLASLDELAEHMSSLLGIDHPCAQRQILKLAIWWSQLLEKMITYLAQYSFKRLLGAWGLAVKMMCPSGMFCSSTAPFIIKCRANSKSELVLKQRPVFRSQRVVKS